MPVATPDVELTSEETQQWAKLPPDRSAIPVVRYRGIGAESGFANAGDAAVGVDVDEFARQLKLMKHAGYRTVDLRTFIDFVQKKPVDLPRRPLLLTFGDGRLDSWTGGDGMLKKLGFNAVMFVDTGTVDAGDNPEYLTWPELRRIQASRRWDVQLHAGKEGHRMIQSGPEPGDTGPYYATQAEGESFADWQKRVRSHIEWGRQTLADEIPAYEPLAFSPPFGDYGQDDPRLGDDLLGWRTKTLRGCLHPG